MKLLDMKLLEKMRQQKLLSTTLLLFTLSIGIVIGTLVNTGVHAQHSGATAPDATPLVIPKAAQVGNEFTKLAKMLEPSVVNITADYTPKLQEGKSRKKGDDDDQGDDDSSDLFRRFFGGPGGGDSSPRPSAVNSPARDSWSTRTATLSPTITWSTASIALKSSCTETTPNTKRG